MKTDAAPLKALSLASRNAPGWMAACRGAAWGLAFLVVLNLLEPFVYFNDLSRNWLTHLSPLTPQLSLAAFAMFATSLLLFAMKPSLPGPVRLALLSLLVMFMGFCGRDLWAVSQQMQEPARTTALIAPLTRVMWLLVVSIGVLTGNSEHTQGRSSWLAVILCAVLSVAGYCVATVQSGRLPDSLSDSPVHVILALNSHTRSEQSSEISVSAIDKSATALMLGGHGQMVVIAGESPQGKKTSVLERLVLSGLDAATPQVVIDTDSTTFDASIAAAARRPELQQERRVIIVANPFQLARIRVLAARHRLTAVVVPAEVAPGNSEGGILMLSEAAQLLKVLVTPAIEFVRNAARADSPSPQAPP